jgi:hypothetical protein
MAITTMSYSYELSDRNLINGHAYETSIKRNNEIILVFTLWIYDNGEVVFTYLTSSSSDYDFNDHDLEFTDQGNCDAAVNVFNRIQQIVSTREELFVEKFNVVRFTLDEIIDFVNGIAPLVKNANCSG